MEFASWEKCLLTDFEYRDDEEISALTNCQYCLGNLNTTDYNLLIQVLKRTVSINEVDDKLRFIIFHQEKSCRHLLLIAVGLLRMFVMVNYVGAHLSLHEENIQYLDGLQKYVEDSPFIMDGESVVSNILFPVLVYLAKFLISNVEPGNIASMHWWTIRAYFIQQKCLEEKSQQIWDRIRHLESLVSSQIKDNLLKGLFKLEMGEIYLYYYDVTSSRSLISAACELSGMMVELGGAMGRRTKFQQHDLPQLVVQVQVNEKGDFVTNETKESYLTDLNVPLADDTRLDNVIFSEDVNLPELSSLQQLALLNDFLARKRHQAKDDVAESEHKAFIEALLKNPKVWVVQYVTLYQRSLLERSHRRTVERALQQLETLKTQKYHFSNALKLFFGSHCPPRYQLDTAIAEICKSLGSINSALDIYLRLNLWEEAVDCYHCLQLRHKAEEIIRQQLDKTESVKLWCLLGDATDEVEHYEKAWDISNHRSARVQRQWGYLYFRQKKFTEAVKHLAISVSLNPLEYPAWMRLAYAAMQVEDWKTCAKAYRHACTLDAENFESWNNLGNAYLKLGDKPRALKVFIEATKCDFNVWQVWDNVLAVSTDCRVFDEALRAYGRLLDLKSNKHIDEEVLGVITRHICQNLSDSSGKSCLKYLKPMLQLLGRLVASVTTNGTLWKLYSDLLITNESLESCDLKQDVMHRSVEYAQKSVSCTTQNPNWSKTLQTCNLVLEYALNLCNRVADFTSKYPDSPAIANFKTVTRFTIRRIITTLEREHMVSGTIQLSYEGQLEELRKCLSNL